MPMDLLRRAEAASEPGEARDALRAAVRAANDRIWVHRNAARIYRETLGDEAAARRVLEELEPLTCSEWRLTAAAWVEVGDRERASKCLERAANNARTPNDLCTLAMGYREAGFADEARLLVDGADAIASRALDCWTVANAINSFGGRQLGLAVLERGLCDATDASEIVVFAHALATHEVDDEVIATTLGKGERRASTVEAWLALALAWEQLAFDRAAAMRCVAAANKLSISSEHERAIAVMRARAGVIELVDDERPRLLPGQLLRAGARTFGWDRDAARLLGWVRARIPRTSLDALARPDQFFVNDDLKTLLEIQRSGAVPHPLPAYFEGLRDVRLGNGPGRDPLTRALACTLLCIEDASATSPGGHELTMAILLRTCRELGPGAMEGAIGLFAAMADAYEATYCTTRAAYLVLFAELALVMAAAWLDPTDPRIDGAIDRLLRDEPRHRARESRSSTWLLGLAENEGGLAGATWRRPWAAMARELLTHPAQARLRELLVS